MAFDEQKKEFDSWEREAALFDGADFFAWLRVKGIPVPVVDVLEEVYAKTHTVAGKVYHIGKMIIVKLWEFAQRNPASVLFLAISAAITFLAGAIPFLGPFLGPAATLLTVPPAVVAGALVDHRDKDPVRALATSAADYFTTMVDIFNCVLNPQETVIEAPGF